MSQDKNIQFISADHDHQSCMATAIAKAEQVCQLRKQRFTKLRKRIFELVWQQHKPIRAYDVLGQLQQDGRAAPPTVYRALDFLLELGLIHRIESLNAFVGCCNPGLRHQGQFLICTACGDFAELDSTSINAAIRHSAEHSGFEVQQLTIEIMGLCPNCKAEKADDKYKNTQLSCY
ncbi:Fur family transcriptional regulator [Psychromonas sp.]|uniref:Fur family transcriptional regulator n=1 Tax=Psychromonas sp. TaxID=1884585 RepID=UPI003569CEC7